MYILRLDSSPVRELPLPASSQALLWTEISKLPHSKVLNSCPMRRKHRMVTWKQIKSVWYCSQLSNMEKGKEKNPMHDNQLILSCSLWSAHMQWTCHDWSVYIRRGSNQDLLKARNSKGHILLTSTSKMKSFQPRTMWCCCMNREKYQSHVNKQNAHIIASMNTIGNSYQRLIHMILRHATLPKKTWYKLVFRWSLSKNTRILKNINIFHLNHSFSL